MLLSFVIVVMVITFYQEQRSERALEALRDLSSPGTGCQGRKTAEDTRPRGRAR